MADQDVHAATTLTEMMRRRAALTPDKPYFHLYGETITYGRLWAVSARYAAGLSRADLRAGDKLCLIYPTCAEFFYTFFGALRMGAVPVPLYPTLSVEATARIFNDSEAVAVATIGWFRKGVDESVAQAPRVRTVLEPPDLEADAPEPADAEPGEEDLAFLQYTSGSTGTRVASCSPTGTSSRPSSSWPRPPGSRPRIASSRGCRSTTTWGSSAAPSRRRSRARRSGSCPRTSATRASGSSSAPRCAPRSQSRPISAIGTACDTSGTPPGSI